MRTTHSDLTREMRRIADAMIAAGLPPVDAEMILASADALDAQDARIDSSTIALRLARHELQNGDAKRAVTSALSWKPSGAGRAL